MLKVDFDGVNKIIQVRDEVDSLEFKTDVYSAWKNWAQEGSNLKYLQAIRTVGGDPLLGGSSLGITFFLVNGWRLRPYSRNHFLNVTGNVYTDEGDNPFVPLIGNFSVAVVMTVSNLTDSTVLESEISQNLDYRGSVYYDGSSATSGTDYPYGTINKPVNNLTDAITVSNKIGAKHIVVKGILPIPNNLNEYSFTGMGNEAMISLTGGDLDDCEFEKLRITGDYTGQIRCKSCTIEDVVNLTGDFENCAFSGSIKPSDDEVNMYMCYSKKLNGSQPTFYFPGVNYSLFNSLSYTGSVNIEGLASAGNHVTFEFMSGTISVASSCTEGFVTVRGEATLENLSSLVIEDSGVINREVISRDVWGYQLADLKTDTIGWYVYKKILSTVRFLGLK